VRADQDKDGMAERKSDPGLHMDSPPKKNVKTSCSDHGTPSPWQRSFEERKERVWLFRIPD